jgi:hypothetical protein
VLCHRKSFQTFKLLFLLVAVSLATMIHLLEGVLYVTQSHSTFLVCWFLSVAASRSYHQDSLVRGIAICCTKSVGIPHRGRVVCPPVERGRARCCGDSSKFVCLVALWLYAFHPPIPLQPCTSSAWLFAPLLPTAP